MLSLGHRALAGHVLAQEQSVAFHAASVRWLTCCPLLNSDHTEEETMMLPRDEFKDRWHLIGVIFLVTLVIVVLVWRPEHDSNV